MGIPQHYSQELPQRCLHLIERLLPIVQRTRMPDGDDAGPLTTTFLLAMSTPIITLPIERVDRHRRKEAVGQEGYVDDRPLWPELAQAVDTALGNQPLRQSPFIADGAWRFASIPYQARHNVARNFPEELASELSSASAVDRALVMPAFDWANCLRNSIAHGGIVYLDEDGLQSHGRPTSMLAFVSAKYPNGNLRLPPQSLVALRISRDDYLSFLYRWVDWLGQSRLSAALAA
jgi:hypothetical protein